MGHSAHSAAREGSHGQALGRQPGSPCCSHLADEALTVASGAARAAGTFCARCELAPFLPVHRVVASNGIGSWGSHGVAYKRRMLELDGVTL